MWMWDSMDNKWGMGRWEVLNNSSNEGHLLPWGRWLGMSIKVIIKNTKKCLQSFLLCCKMRNLVSQQDVVETEGQTENSLLSSLCANLWFVDVLMTFQSRFSGYLCSNSTKNITVCLARVKFTAHMSDWRSRWCHYLFLTLRKDTLFFLKSLILCLRTYFGCLKSLPT